jgi:hypothetical protein
MSNLLKSWYCSWGQVEFGKATQECELREMTDSEIIEKLLDGFSLRTFMVPDSAIASNYPEHRESYELVHVIVKGDYFWGKPYDSVMPNVGREIHARDSFYYTNSGDFFCNYSLSSNSIRVLPKRRYKVHNWILKKTHELIWDSERNDPNVRIDKEIENASRLTVAMLDSEDVWNIHPSLIAFYWPSTDSFQVGTIGEDYPIPLRNPAALKAAVETEFDKLDPSFPIEKQIFEFRNVGMFNTHYRLLSDGTYANFFDKLRSTTQRYKRLKIFSDNLSSDPN